MASVWSGYRRSNIHQNTVDQNTKWSNYPYIQNQKIANSKHTVLFVSSNSESMTNDQKARGEQYIQPLKSRNHQQTV